MNVMTVSEYLNTTATDAVWAYFFSWLQYSTSFKHNSILISIYNALYIHDFRSSSYMVVKCLLETIQTYIVGISEDLGLTRYSKWTMLRFRTMFPNFRTSPIHYVLLLFNSSFTTYIPLLLHCLFNIWYIRYCYSCVLQLLLVATNLLLLIE